MVERVAKAIWKETRSASYDWEHETDGGKIIARDRAHAALDASPIAELVEALETARGYVAKVHGSLGRAMGPDNIVLPDLQKIDAALVRAKGIGGDNG